MALLPNVVPAEELEVPKRGRLAPEEELVDEEANFSKEPEGPVKASPPVAEGSIMVVAGFPFAE